MSALVGRGPARDDIVLLMIRCRAGFRLARLREATMNNRYARILAGCSAGALAVTLGVPAALAAGTWTVQPGGSVQAASAGLFVIDTTTGNKIECASVFARGTLKNGSGLPGADAGSLSTVNFFHCTGQGGGSDLLNSAGLPWHVNFGSYNAAKGVVRGTISHLHIEVFSETGSGCNPRIDGTRGTALDGKVTFRYIDRTGQLLVLRSFSNLHFYNVSSGCLGLFDNGDPAVLDTGYNVSPKQAITSP